MVYALILLRKTLLSILLFVTVFVPSVLRASPYNEEELISAYLYNFTNYLEWQAFKRPSALMPYNICIFNNDKVFKNLLEVTTIKPTISARRVQLSDKIDDCHIIFFGKKSGTNIKNIISSYSNKSILMVSDQKNFLSKGGGIYFLKHKGRITMSIRQDVLQQVGIRASSKLLKLAILVDNEWE